jgi:L-asparagine transporter-like permease
VKIYGEIEFTFSIVKIIAICTMILTGLYILLIDPNLVAGATIKNLWQAATVGPHTGDLAFSGFFPHGFIGLVMAIPIITFSFGGLELIGITAAETANPRKTIPKAINQVMFRILVFYIASLAVLLSLYHWSNLKITDSPFVMIFDRIGFKYAAWTLNLILLTATLSVYNSCIYSNSRMLYGLALQKNAPQIFTKTNARGVPIVSVLISSLLTFLVVPLNYFIPNWFDAFQIITNFAVVCAIINWCMITISHMKFKRQKQAENYKTLFQIPFYPFSDYVTLIFYSFILILMMVPQFGMAKHVAAIPIWLLLTYIGYKMTKKTHATKLI